MDVTSNIVRSGEWFGVYGQIFGESEPISTAEVWLLINGKYVKCIPQTSWHNRFWFHVRLGMGRYFLQVEGYKVLVEKDVQTEKGVFRLKKEHKIKSPIIEVVSLPKFLNSGRLLPFRFEVENWRKISLDEGLSIAHKVEPFIIERFPDTSRVYLVGGVLDRGWTRRDVDLVILSETLYRREGLKARRFEKECEVKAAYPISILTRETEPDKEKIQIYP